jgi:hypothetical protein
MLDIQTLETWLWDAACAIRGPVDAPKFKDYILPLVFLKRLSDVFEDEITHLGLEFGGREQAEKLVERDHRLVRFYIPPGSALGGDPPRHHRPRTVPHRRGAGSGAGEPPTSGSDRRR